MQNSETMSKTLLPVTVPETEIAVATRLGTHSDADASAVSLHGDTTMMERFAARAIGTTTTGRTDAAEGQTTTSGAPGVAKCLLSALIELRKQNRKWILQQTRSTLDYTTFITSQ